MSDNIKFDKDKVFEVYKLMIRARDAHQQSYTQWMNLFYVAEGAVIFAYINSGYDPLMLSLFGFAVSLLGYLSCRGYYFWTHNWIDQLYRLEKKYFDRELRVYSTFSLNTANESNILRPLEPANLSTSKLTLMFFLLIFWLWAFLLINNSLKAIPWNLKDRPLCFTMVCAVGSVLLVNVTLKIINFKKLRKHLETHWLNNKDERDIECRDE